MSNISNQLISRSRYSPKLVFLVLAIIVWSFFLWRAVNVFKPGVTSAVPYNSDCAIPVLMSNDERPLTPFNLYKYGLDRWGGWPFLATQLVRRATGFHWSPQRLATVQTFWLFLSSLLIGGLSRRHWAILALTFLLSVCVFAGHQIFELGQVFAWQIGALLASWYALRRYFEAAPHPKSRQRRTAWLAATFVFSYLAIWSSFASTPFLIFLFGLETFRITLAGRMSALPDARRRVGLRWLAGLVPIALAAVVERLQAMLYHRYAMQHYGSDFRTTFALDFGNLTQNFQTQVSNLAQTTWSPLSLLALLAILAALCVGSYAWLAKRDQLLNRLKAALDDDTVLLAVGAFGIALINFVLATTATHVRINSYDARYVLLTNLFGALSGGLTLFLIAQFIARNTRAAAWVKPFFLAAGLALLLIMFPAKVHQPDYASFEDAARALAEKSPRGILLADYWGAYVFASLQPIDAMTPVPFEGQQNRMPWTRDAISAANDVVVQYPGSRLNRFAKPAKRLAQYGARFRLADPVWYNNGSFAFARYVRDESAIAPDDRTRVEFLARQPFALVLNREPEPAELEKSASEISQCGQDEGCILEQQIRANLSLVHSAEFNAGGGLVYRLYVSTLGRAPSYAEWERNRQKLTDAGNNANQFAEQWIGEPEFLERYPTSLSSGEFSEKLSQTAGIAREQHSPDAQSSNEGGASRASTLLSIANRASSPTVNDHAFVTLCYFLYLSRDPDASGFKSWVRTFSSEPGDEVTVISGFLTSAEYRAKFPHP